MIEFECVESFCTLISDLEVARKWKQKTSMVGKNFQKRARKNGTVNKLLFRNSDCGQYLKLFMEFYIENALVTRSGKTRT